MSFLTRLRRRPTRAAADDPTQDGRVAGVPGDGAAADDTGDRREGDAVAEPAGDRGAVRRVAAVVATTLAGLLVLFALIAPNELALLTPGAFVRIPAEGLLVVALLLVLPAKARRVVAALVGVALGLLTIMKVLDMGFFEVLARPFDPVLDWILLAAAAEFLTDLVGRAGAIAAVVAALILAATVLILMTLSTLRLTRLVVRHHTTAIRAAAVLGVGWVACALLGAQIVPGVPVAAHEYDRVLQVNASLRDREAFAAEAAVDAFRDTPGDELLTALRGKDVVVVFVESYGRDAVEDPELAPQVGAVLDAGDRRLGAVGFDSRSAFLTAPTVGGSSWLAHATLLSGLWIDNQQRYRTLVGSDRLTLNGAFQRAGWRTVAVMPGITRTWPEGAFFGYDEVYAAPNLGYRGPRLNWGAIPDQYAMSAFERFERATPERAPVMAEIALLSSHAPWVPIPPLVDWDDVGDGSFFETVAVAGDSAEEVWRDPARVRTEYRRAIEYSLNTLISYVETYGDDDLVLVFLGDHQPARSITGEDAIRDVPVTIVTRDPAVLDRISGWGWHDGLKPGPRAPVWQMDAFRDQFLTAFGPPTP